MMDELLEVMEEARDMLSEAEIGSDEWALSIRIDIALRHYRMKPCGLGSWCGREICDE